MSSDINTIRSWLRKAQTKKARYLIVCHDAFDMGDFPLYIMTEQEFWKKCPTKFGDTPFASLQNTAHEVYDLELNIEDQLQEKNAWHPPIKG